MTLSQVRRLALALPEVTEEPHFHKTSFRVKGKIIATAQPDEPFLNVMIPDSAREPALAMYANCVEKLFWGKKVMGIRVNLEAANAEAVRDLLRQAWEAKAPKALVNAAQSPHGLSNDTCG